MTSDRIWIAGTSVKMRKMLLLHWGSFFHRQARSRGGDWDKGERRMNHRMRVAVSCFLILMGSLETRAQNDFLDASWGDAELDPIMDKTLRLHLAPSTDGLTAAEKKAVESLLQVGQIFHELYLDSRHPEALFVRSELGRLDQQGVAPARTKNLRDLYRMMRGPIATTLENKREAFLPVGEEVPGRNVYPPGITKDGFDSFLVAHPDRAASLLHLRSVVREANRANAGNDLAVLDRYPVLDRLHQGLRSQLEAVHDNSSGWQYYAVPYSVAYADRILEAYGLLNDAAEAIEGEDAAFGRYLRLRARDLLTDDYEAGDAAWVTGQFTGNLNLLAGSYETYDDKLYGVKSFFAFTILLRDHERSAELASATASIQEIEDALPYESERRVRENIPVGVYNILADFAQSRGTNTATILPNESHLSRQYGRTILLRANIMTNPQLFSIGLDQFKAATEPAHHDELIAEGNFYRTLWHEIGHYLGVLQTADGRELDDALQETADLFEELKSDLVSLLAAKMLHEKGIHSDTRLRAIYAGGIKRVLQKNRPRRTQAYGTMQLMQWNWYLDKGLLEFDSGSGRMTIDYSQYDDAVTGLLQEVLAIQLSGDRDRANAFIDQWAIWDDEVHGVVAANIRSAVRYRYRLVTYEILDGESSGE